MAVFQSTLPARGATEDVLVMLLNQVISIHAPRTGSDGHAAPAPCERDSISIHAPRTGSDTTNEC